MSKEVWKFESGIRPVPPVAAFDIEKCLFGLDRKNLEHQTCEELNAPWNEAEKLSVKAFA